MNIRETKKFLSENWPILVSVIIVLTPIVWSIASIYYLGRIESLREQNDLLREQRIFLERKLKSTKKNHPKDISENSDMSLQVQKFKALNYPAIRNSYKLSRDEIRNLADFYELTKSWKFNPHLKFKDGDISYWHKQGLTENEIKLEFDSRRIVLEQAEKKHQTIDNQGNLSSLAQKIQAKMLRNSNY